MTTAMAALAPIQPIDPASSNGAVSIAAQPGKSSFAHWMMSRVEKADHDVMKADALAKAFATDDSIPVHQVIYAMEQARISTELMLQVRTHLVNAYQELSRMQL